MQSKVFVPNMPPNVHLNNVKEFFGNIVHDNAKIPKGLKFIFQCYTNRSGSNYLAELLASGGYLPNAGENLNFDTIINHSRRLNFRSFQDYFSFLVSHTSKNGYVCIKIAPGHLELMAVSGILDQIIEQSYFVLVERSDKLAQAISHCIAFQTGRFTSYMEGTKNEAKFDRNQISNVIFGIAEAYRTFSIFFARNGLVPCQINYEHFIRDPSQFLPIVGGFVGLPDIKFDLAKVRTSKQGGGLNAQWRQIYLDRNSSDDHPTHPP